jgi:hypothetical protein
MIAKMKRREFITLLGGAAAWPLAVSAFDRCGRPAVPIDRFILGARRCGAAVSQFGKVVILPAGAGFLSAYEKQMM